MSSSNHRNLVVVGGELWCDSEKRASTSFCKHIESEKRRAGRDIGVLSLHDIDLGIKDGQLFCRMPDGTVFTKESKDLPTWALLYVVPPRVAFFLENLGITCYSSYEMASKFEDKMLTHILYAEHFVHPSTLFYGADSTVNDIVFSEESYPFILKGVSGQGGTNVARVNTSDEMFSFMDEVETSTDLMMLQQAMPKADDLRVYCLGDEIIGSVLRRPKEGIWKANLEFNPKREKYELGRLETETVLAAMEKLPHSHRGLYSFDFLFDENDGLVLCEANCNVGTNGLDAVGLGKDLFLRYVDYIRREVQKEANKAEK